MSTPSKEQVITSLANILASELFFQSERQQRFLQYIVERSLSGEADKINQYSIGIDVFDSDSSFDPAIDSIVRVEAGRLRAKLREYYSSTGKREPVRIEVRKGSYSASFAYQHSVDDASTGVEFSLNEEKSS